MHRQNNGTHTNVYVSQVTYEKMLPCFTSDIGLYNYTALLFKQQKKISEQDIKT